MEKDALNFLQNINTEFNLLKSKRPDNKIIKTFLISNNGTNIFTNNICLLEPNTLKFSTYDKNGNENHVLCHYLNCQILFSVEDKINSKSDEKLDIGFHREDLDSSSSNV